MNILEKIRDAEPGSMVTISSPCKEGSCATAESSFPVDDLRKAMGFMTATVTTTQGDKYELQTPPIPPNTVCVPSVWTADPCEANK